MSTIDLSKAFRDLLNRHGYSLQYSLLRTLIQLRADSLSPWEFEASEFPIAINGTHSRTDLVLRHMTKPAYLIGECKRADPAMKEWCFVRAPYTRRGRDYEPLILDSVYRKADNTQMPAPVVLGKLEHAMSLGFELRSQEKGDGSGTGRGAIEEAIAQLLRSVNGIIEFLINNRLPLQQTGPTLLLPVLFTTATLWESDLDLASADLSRGTIDTEARPLTRRPWIAYQYPTSPGLKTELPAINSGVAALAPALDILYTRTVLIVTATEASNFASTFDLDIENLKYAGVLNSSINSRSAS